MYFLYANPQKPDTIQAAGELARLLLQQGHDVMLDDWLHDLLKLGHRGNLKELKGLDALISLGGDGTLLRTLAAATRAKVPVLGVNMGRVGFLLECDRQSLLGLLDRLHRKEYEIEERMMLRCSLTGDPQDYLVMNDVVVCRGGNPSSIVVDAYADEELVYSTHGDGMIVSTPTGSTGYCLAAGGPVVHPLMEALVILPICTHKAQQLPIVLKENVRIRLFAASIPGRRHQIVLDGQTTFDRFGPAEVLIERAKERVQFIRFEPQHFFTRLRLKQAEWSGK